MHRRILFPARCFLPFPVLQSDDSLQIQLRAEHCGSSSYFLPQPWCQRYWCFSDLPKYWHHSEGTLLPYCRRKYRGNAPVFELPLRSCTLLQMILTRVQIQFRARERRHGSGRPRYRVHLRRECFYPHPLPCEFG